MRTDLEPIGAIVSAALLACGGGGGDDGGGESAFLHPIIDMIAGAVRGHRDLDAAQVDAWLQSRRRQIDEAQLVYIAHQIDFFGRAPGARSARRT